MTVAIVWSTFVVYRKWTFGDDSDPPVVPEVPRMFFTDRRMSFFFCCQKILFVLFYIVDENFTSIEIKRRKNVDRSDRDLSAVGYRS